MSWPAGQGTYTYRNGDVYQGDFIDHHMTGRGIMQYANGDRWVLRRIQLCREVPNKTAGRYSESMHTITGARV